MTPLITALMLWLCANFDLPSTQDLPSIEFVPHSKIVELRYHGLTRPQSSDAMTTNSDAREPVAVYMNTSKTIYLREGWSGSTPAELSVLVHELVHHLQNVGQIRFECTQEREQVAYKAQAKWLGLFGRDLSQEFQLDPFTLLVSTRCGILRSRGVGACPNGTPRRRKRQGRS